MIVYDNIVNITYIKTSTQTNTKPNARLPSLPRQSRRNIPCQRQTCHPRPVPCRYPPHTITLIEQPPALDRAMVQSPLLERVAESYHPWPPTTTTTTNPNPDPDKQPA